MKKVFDDLYLWSVFNETRQLDFNGHLWVRPQGNVLIDPVPMIQSDLEQLERLGGAAWIVVTNQDHERQTAFFRQRTHAKVAAHSQDAVALSVPVDHPLEDNEEILPGLKAIHLRYGKSPGEIALYWPDKKLVLSGDLVVGAPVGRFTLLMDEKLQDPPRAALELRKLLALDFAHLLVGDGHAILYQARERLLECLEERCDIYINKINADEVEWCRGGERPGYTWEAKELGLLVGARRLGYWLIRLPPGQSFCPLHFHHVAEELFCVMEGECTLISTRGNVPVRQGDFLAFPPGPSGVHKFKNEGAAPCVLLALGTAEPYEVCEYPDSEKVAAGTQWGRWRFRKKDAVGYWEGE